MTITTTTCPAWCTFDHAKSEARYRELAALDELSPDVRRRIDGRTYVPEAAVDAASQIIAAALRTATVSA